MKISLRAFTVLELLVATAVMALVLVLFLQITNRTAQTSKVAEHQLDAAQTARRVLDALSSDMARTVLGVDSTILTQTSGGAPSLAFLTSGRGPDTIPTRFLAVGYNLANRQLSRSYKAVGWSDIPGTYPGGLLYAAEAAASNPDFSAPLSSGVLQFSVFAILEDGSQVSLLTPPGNSAGVSGSVPFEGQTVPTGWTALVPARPPTPAPLNSTTARVRALFVAIVSADEESLALPGASAVAFSQPASDPVATWETELQSQTLPAPLRSAIRFTTKTIPLL